MWNNNDDHQMVILPPRKGFLTPSLASNHSEASSISMSTPMSDTKRSSPANKRDLFHVIHKVPAGDSPYVRAKHVQLIERDPSRAISLFWSAINGGDRVDSALKDMAIVMKQLNRSDEAIEAIKSFRHLCPVDSQESIDNVLVELYKRAGRIEEEVEMLQGKLKRIEEGTAFGGRRTKTARSQGKKVHISIEEEKSRILGNLAWAYMQQNDYKTAEEYYRRALVLESDNNKKCNLAICLMHSNRVPEAKSLLRSVKVMCGTKPMDESFAKSFERACKMLTELGADMELEPNVKYRNGCNERPTSLVSPMVAQRRWEGGKREQLYSGNHCNNKANSHDNIAVLEDMSLRCGQLGRRNNLDYLKQPMTVDQLKRNRTGVSETKPETAWQRNTEPQASSWQRKSNSSPALAKCNVRTPFTQPRRCLWGFSDADQREIEFGNSKKKFSSDNDDWWKKGSWKNNVLNKSSTEECDSSQGKLTEEEFPGSTETPSNTIDSSISNKKKSWADMAEEEENEELCELPRDFFNSSQKFEFDESTSLQTQMKNGDLRFEFKNCWNSEDEFKDENMNCNVAQGSPYLQTQMKRLEQCGLKDEYISPGLSDASSKNQSVRRMLFFDQGKNSVPGKNIRLLRRRNRLKVFQDITQSP